MIPVTYYNVLASLALSDISLFIRRGYGSVIFIAIPDFIVLESTPSRFNMLNILRVSVKPEPCYDDPILAIHYDRLWSLRLASLLGFNVVLAPLTRTDLTLLALEIPLRGYEDAWSILDIATNVNNVTFVNALAGVEAEPIVSYAVLSGYEVRVLTKCIPKLRASRILEEMRGIGPEIEFSSRRTIEFTLNIIKSKLGGRCMYCGGFTGRNKGACDLCNIIKASSIDVSISS